MEFELTDEEQAFQEAVRKFGDQVLRPNERRIDSEGQIPREVLDEMARLGLLAMPVPTITEGSAGRRSSPSSPPRRSDAATSRWRPRCSSSSRPAGAGCSSRHGTEEAKREMPPRSARGRRSSASPPPNRPAAATRPGCGRRSSTERQLDSSVRGEKSFLSGVEEAKSLGRRAPDAHKSTDGGGFNFLYVPTNSPGNSTQKFENMGRMGISTGAITYDDTKVPRRHSSARKGTGSTTRWTGSPSRGRS